MICDRSGVPLHFVLSPGQTHDAAMFDELMVETDRNLVSEQGKPIAWPLAESGDKGYRANWIDEYLLGLGIKPVIPSKANEDRHARRVEFDREAYRERNIVERLIGWLKESRRVLCRFEKTAINFAGMVRLAFIRRLFRILMTQYEFTDRA